MFSFFSCAKFAIHFSQCHWIKPHEALHPVTVRRQHTFYTDMIRCEVHTIYEYPNIHRPNHWVTVNFRASLSGRKSCSVHIIICISLWYLPFANALLSFCHVHVQIFVRVWSFASDCICANILVIASISHQILCLNSILSTLCTGYGLNAPTRRRQKALSYL